MKMLLLVGAILFGLNAFATVDSEGEVLIPYTPAQAGMDFEYLAQNWSDEYSNTKMYCMANFMYFDHYSSSALPKYEFMMKPFYIPSYPSNYEDVQLNALADGVIKVVTDWEKFDKYVSLDPNSWKTIHEPEFTVDVSGYDQSTKAGRLQAITMAKLAIISLHYNMAQYGSLFRLTIEVKGLPANQNEFAKPGFTKVVAKTNFPYSGPSPVAQNFYEELLAKDFCQKDYDTAKSFAQ